MTVESLQWSSVKPYVRGYEHRVGTAIIALDPTQPANQSIVDLARAARDPDGLVRFETDVVLLAAPHPVGILHVVANRGMVTTLPYSTGGSVIVAATGNIASDDEWLLRRGLSVLWVGWQWDVARRPGAVGLDVPEALGADGLPIAGQARLGFQPLTDTPRRRLADQVLPQMGQFRALPVADLDDPAAVLTARAWFNGPAQVVDRKRWRFPDAQHVEMDGCFQALTHYELTYVSGSCPVTGAGLAAVRDVVADVRRDYRYALTMGGSQSGRWLRQFLYDTGNADETGRPVFDGVHCHIAGGRRGEFNHRYAQPSTMNALGFSHLPPFSPTDGLFERAYQLGTVPKVVSTNTATEYWRGDASLAHPVPEGPEWRCYLYAGAHHAAQMPGYVESLPVQLPGNLIDVTPLSRAHFVVLQEWVVDGREPPPSAVPRLEDGTGVTREDALKVLAQLPWAATMTLPAPEALLGMPPLDLGPRTDEGIGTFPPAVTGPARPCLVSALDDDGNEVAGVRLPTVSVPLDVSLGWNPERPRGNVPVEVWNLVGGRLCFPREEILRRYQSRDHYLDLVRSAAERLIGERHLLEEDLHRVIAGAAEAWDAAIVGDSADP